MLKLAACEAGAKQSRPCFFGERAPAHRELVNSGAILMVALLNGRRWPLAREVGVWGRALEAASRRRAEASHLILGSALSVAAISLAFLCLRFRVLPAIRGKAPADVH